jgi:putative DNA primase/helicase
MHTTKLNHALHYAKLGIPVLPLHCIGNDGICSCGGTEANPKCKSGKHPFAKLAPNGLNSATTNVDTIRQWFEGKPYNLGICTGKVGGFFVLDRDDKDGGDATLAEWEADNGNLPATLTQRTGNGYHYLFKLPIGIDIRNSQKKLATGIDIRGTGGYICAAPSVHANGNQYQWIGCELMDVTRINNAPQWLIDKIISTTSKSPANNISAVNAALIGNAFLVPDKVTDGEGRESLLLRYAGHLRGKGLDQATIERILLDYNQQHIAPPLDDGTVLDRARRYQATELVAAANDSDWPELKPLDESLPPIPPFPIRLLPDLIGDYVVDVAERMSCPVEFPAIGAMVVLSAAVGSQIHCAPYAQGAWMVPAGAWGMVVSSAGALKSPPLSEMLRPLYEMDKMAAEHYRLALEQYQIDKAIYDNAVKAAIKSGVAPVGLSVPVEPAMTRYMVNDSTYEMLVAIAAANPNGFLVWRDELVGWFHSLNKENQKEARGLYLTGWSGTEGYATDRIGRGHVRADRVNLSLLGTIQPNVLRSIVHDAVSGGAGDDGLVARFQMAVFPDPVRDYVKVDRAPNMAAMRHYEETIKTLLNLDLQAIGASVMPNETACLPFDDEAQQLFDDWRQELEDRIRDPQSDEHPAMLSHLGKYRSLFPKLALVLHLADGKTGSIGKTAAARAMIWTKYLEAHARRIYHTATNRAMQSAVTLANKIKAGRVADGFTRSDVLVKEWAGLRTAEEVNTALTVLRDMNWLTSTEDRRTGGRPAEHYYISPRVKRAA